MLKLVVPNSMHYLVSNYKSCPTFPSLQTQVCKTKISFKLFNSFFLEYVLSSVANQVAGYAVGGGHVLHMVCDLTIAADNAIFGQTGPKVLVSYCVLIFNLNGLHELIEHMQVHMKIPVLATNNAIMSCFRFLGRQLLITVFLENFRVSTIIFTIFNDFYVCA